MKGRLFVGMITYVKNIITDKRKGSKMIMKKKLVVSMLIGLSLCITACGISNEKVKSTKSQKATSVTETSAEEETEKETKSKKKSKKSTKKSTKKKRKRKR